MITLFYDRFRRFTEIYCKLRVDPSAISVGFDPNGMENDMENVEKSPACPLKLKFSRYGFFIETMDGLVVVQAGYNIN